MTFAVSTGIDSFSNPGELGALYPFPSIVGLFVALAVVLWLGWHALQIRGETSENREAIEMYENIGMERAMFHGGSGLIATDEEWEAELRRRGEQPVERPGNGA